MLQKVGALGSDLRGKKVVISLSPGWFLKVKSGQKGYEANFSPMGASKMNASPGWKDLELLLRTLARVHARALILSMPISGNFYDHAGISRPLVKIITRSFVHSCNDTIFR